ncbi:hypothetical protein BaRGS_00016948 [Batillaria attramentaria]|uniref:Uncharacterized protein n=1 Tax=Batillaria attramentaria TaxID=370345 RepID=A0ABD0KX01_9CAEN
MCYWRSRVMTTFACDLLSHLAVDIYNYKAGWVQSSTRKQRTTRRIIRHEFLECRNLATHGMPLAECKWDVKDKQIIALTLTDNNASEIVTIKHDISQCMVEVGSKAFVRCDQDEKVLSVSVLFPDFEFGETRTYICNATLFGDGVWGFMTFRTNATKKLQLKGDEPRDDDECSCLGYILMAVALAAVVLGLLPLNIYSLFKCFQAKFRSPHEDSKMDSTQEIDRQNDPVKLDQSGTVESKPTTDAELGEPPEELSDSDKKEQDVEELRKLLGKDEEGGSEAAKGGRRKDTPCAPTDAERPYNCTSASQAPGKSTPLNESQSASTLPRRIAREKA